MKRIIILMFLSLYSSVNWGQNEVKQKKGRFSIGIDYVHVVKPYKWWANKYQFLFREKIAEFSNPAIYGQYRHKNDMVFQLKFHAFDDEIRIKDLGTVYALDPEFYIENFTILRRGVYLDMLVGYNVLNFWEGCSLKDRFVVNVMGGLRNYFSESENIKGALSNRTRHNINFNDSGFYSDVYTIRPTVQITTQLKVYKEWSLTGSYNFVYNKKSHNFSMLHLGVNYTL